MNRVIVAFVLLQSWLGSNVHAGEIRHISAEYAKGIYTIEFDAVVSAGQPQIYGLITDYDHLHYLNDTIVESKLISERNAPLKKCRLLLHTCVLFFCRDAVMVEDIQENGGDEVVATIDPAQSDFNSGLSTWKISPAGTGQTSIMLRRNLEPAFWVPPVIGPWMIKKKMLQELTVMLERLEHYASDQPGT